MRRLTLWFGWGRWRDFALADDDIQVVQRFTNGLLLEAGSGGHRAAAGVSLDGVALVEAANGPRQVLQFFVDCMASSVETGDGPYYADGPNHDRLGRHDGPGFI